MSVSICVVGSINVDLVVTVDRLPRPGETVLGGRYAVHDGGKGANQAVAAARAGADVAMIGAVGRDDHGRQALAALTAEGVDVSRVREIEAEPTGVALIAVGPRGENQIVVAPGANAAFTLEEDDLALIASASALLTNHEIPNAAIVSALRAAAAADVTSILNPAPARGIPAEVLHLGPILTPNEHELVVAIGNDETEAALEELVGRTSGPVIVTQGPAGALLAHRDRRERFPGHPANDVIDSTGAGDTFNGVLAAWLAEGGTLENAIAAANVAGALSVSAAGARDGMPRRDAIEALIGS